MAESGGKGDAASDIDDRFADLDARLEKVAIVEDEGVDLVTT